jgi:hypothetical protein
VTARYRRDNSIDAPPTTDRVAPTAPIFTRDEVDQVLSDL